MTDEENKFEDLKDIIKDNLKDRYQGETPGSFLEGKVVTNFPFKTVEEYQRITGKRFRMKKDQKDRGLNRDQAFQEFIHRNNQKKK